MANTNTNPRKFKHPRTRTTTPTTTTKLQNDLATLMSNLNISPTTTPVPEILSLATTHLKPATPVKEEDITAALAAMDLTPNKSPFNPDFHPDDPTFPVPGCSECEALWREVPIGGGIEEWWVNVNEEVGLKVEWHMLDHLLGKCGGSGCSET